MTVIIMAKLTCANKRQLSLIFFTDGGNFVTVCGSLSEKMSRARENPGDGATLPGNGSPIEALSNEPQMVLSYQFNILFCII